MRSCIFILVTTLALAASQELLEPAISSVVTIPNPDSNALKSSSLRTEKVKLQLCDCQAATGEPGGLSCDKEGFFITSFERQGQWVAGGGSVPLSRAVCCRPCLPTELPDGMADDDAPLAVVSMGCHTSTDPLGVRCEATGDSFVSGFTDAVRVFTSVDTRYPIDTTQCCTPALLMESGDAWELERCGCGISEDAEHPVNCGGNGTNALLSGFDFFRVSPLGQVVPVGPAKCCGVCLSGKVHPVADCKELNHCNGNGVCLLGRCECLDGWGGADCSQSLSGHHWGSRIPPWAIALIVIGSCLLAMVMLSAAAHLAELVYEARGRDDDSDDEGRRPLLLRIDADDAGSVGSEDTAECEEDLEERVEERIEGVIHRLESSAVPSTAGTAAAAARDDTEGGSSSSLQREEMQEEELEELTEDEEENEADVEAQRHMTTPTTAPGNAPTQDQVEIVKPEGGGLQSYTGIGPLSNVDCVVCMIRPVQTVIVPCGHVCMCRRCSRRLHRCPICRKEVVRRQRLYV